jgi:hypothetical protein
VEFCAVLLLIWSEYALSTWSPEIVASGTDELFYARFWSWLAAVSLGCLVGLAMGAGIAIWESRHQRHEISWLNGVVLVFPLTSVVIALAQRNFPWL